MASEMEELLDSLNAALHCAHGQGRLLILKRRLLPLLEAGQAMRNAGKVPINFVAELGEAQRAWDAAKKG